MPNWLFCTYLGYMLPRREVSRHELFHPMMITCDLMITKPCKGLPLFIWTFRERMLRRFVVVVVFKAIKPLQGCLSQLTWFSGACSAQTYTQMAHTEVDNPLREHSTGDINLQPLPGLFLCYLNSRHFSLTVRWLGSRDSGGRNSSKLIAWCPRKKITVSSWQFPLLNLRKNM